MAVSKALRKALMWGAEEQQELADEFLDHKVFTWVETILELLGRHGVDASPEEVEPSDEILKALADEARAHALSVVLTYNRDVHAFLDRQSDRTRDEILADYEAWADDRADARSELIAVTEAYSAATDATMAFYQANDLEPLFDFGGHPELGDDDPACEVCAELVYTSPHPLARVLEVGSPHINCRQDWHATDETDDVLGDEVRVPTAPSGIVGRDALVTRTGSHSAAVEELRRLAEES